MLGRALRGEDAVSSFLFSENHLDWSEALADGISVGGAVLLCVASFALLWPRTRLPLAFVTLWTTFLMLCDWVLEPRWPGLVPAEATVRWLAPFGLFLWLRPTRWTRAARTMPRLAEGLLRVAAAATFVGHGLKALWLKGEFLDFLFVASHRLLGTDLSQATAERLLHAIGIVDLAVASLILVRRWPAVAAWMTLWGTVTALARIVSGGLPNWSEAALRAPNAGIPLVLLLAWVATGAMSRDDVPSR